MRYLITTLLLLYFSLMHFGLKADSLSASVNYTNGEYQKALDEFSQLAKLGNSDAMFNIAVMHLHGRGVKKDINKAYAWFSLAGEFGITDAKNTAEYIATQTQNSDALHQAKQQLDAELSYQRYVNTLAPQFNETFNTLIQPIKSFNVDPVYPEHAVDRGIEGWVWVEYDIDGAGAVINAQIIDSYPQKTFDNAMLMALKRWRFKQSEQLPIKRRSLLYHFTTFKGKRYQQGFSRQQREYQKHIAEVIEQAENGNALWQYRIAQWLTTDKHNASKLLKYHWPKESEAQNLMLNAAKNGYPFAQYRIATQLLAGDKTAQDRKKGLNWLLLSAQNGFASAQYRLGIELLVKKSVHYDMEKARLWLTQASDKGHLLAKTALTRLALSQADISESEYKTLHQQIDSVLQQNANNAEAWYLKAKLSYQQNDISSAKKLLDRAIDNANAQKIDLSEMKALKRKLAAKP
ncbi:MAG: TonB family protein [Pseudomonadota bacterium]|nr:TonB family protein [Pseudomonadota bacterium]